MHEDYRSEHGHILLQQIQGSVHGRCSSSSCRRHPSTFTLLFDPRACIKKFTRIFCIVIVSLSIMDGSVFPASRPYEVTLDKVVATVNNKPVTLADYHLYLKLSGEPVLDEEVSEKTLKRLIEEKIIVADALKQGIGASTEEIETGISEFVALNGITEEELESYLREDGIQMEDYRRMVEEQIMIAKHISFYVETRVVIRDDEIEKFYNDHREQFLKSPEKVELKAIFLKLKDRASVTEITDLKRRALKIVSLLQGGESFDTLLYVYSDEPLRSLDGKLGIFERETLVPPLDKAAFSLKEGGISGPISVQDGIYFLKVVKSTERSYRGIEEAREDIYNAIFAKKKEKIYNEWIKSLWEQASVSITKG